MFHEKYSTCQDSEIISRYRVENDNRYVGILYQRYGHLVLGLCLKYLKNKVEAQDAVVNIFSKLIADLLKHDVEHFKSWLYTYSRNYCLMELRKRQSALRRELELQENSHFFVDYDEAAHLNEREQQYEILEKAMQQLKEEQRACITQFYLERRSYAEITKLTGYPLNEVKSYIQNGKRNLKLIMEGLKDEKQKKQR